MKLTVKKNNPLALNVLEADDFLARLLALGTPKTPEPMPEPMEGESEEEFDRRFLAHLLSL